MPRVADIIKIITMFIKTIFKDFQFQAPNSSLSVCFDEAKFGDFQ